MEKKILFLEWSSFGMPFLIESFHKLGYQTEKYFFPRDRIDTRNDADYTEQLTYKLLGGGYTFVFSFNYFPIVAIACKAVQVPYVSWTYDSPFKQLHSKTLEYETNFPFVFDKHTVRQLQDKGYANVRYLPMAAPEEYYTSLLKKPYNRSRYQSDLSFVGSLYSEDFHNPFRKLDNLKGYYKGFIDAVVRAQKKIYGYNFLQEMLEGNPVLMKELIRQCPIHIFEDELEGAEWVYANYYLARQVTRLERYELLNRLSALYSTKIYTPEGNKVGMAQSCGKADYYTEAPYIYANSKINLNITLRSIQSGMPLRAFDIMGCGGLLLSNYQEDFFEYFEPERDLLLYGSEEEAVEKVDYYLQHDQEGKRVAENGRNKVLREHTYFNRAQEICGCAEQYWK